MPITSDELAMLIDRQWQPLLIWAGECRGAEEDVIQEAFVRLARMETPPDNPIAWLYVVTRNLANSQRTAELRRNRRQRSVARPESTEMSPTQKLDADELQSMLCLLTDPMRRVVVAKIWGGLTFDAIAALEETSATTVFRRYHEALTQLRERYGVKCQTFDH